MYSRGQNRHARYHSALGSARETLSCLEDAALSRYVEEDAQLWDQLDRVVGTLLLLTRAQRCSTGQSPLADSVDNPKCCVILPTRSLNDRADAGLRHQALAEKDAAVVGVLPLCNADLTVAATLIESD
jgi:hypothetical protein